MRATRSDKGQRRTQWLELTCEQCGTEFERRISQTKDRAFCSRLCFQKSGAAKHGGRPRTLTPGLHPNHPTELLEATSKYGEPEGWTLTKGHVTYRWPEHPYSKDNRITEQKAVAYEHLGDVLNGHHISHLDGDKANNSWTNLVVRDPGSAIPQDEGIILWQGFYQWAVQHSPEVVDEYLEAAAK